MFVNSQGWMSGFWKSITRRATALGAVTLGSPARHRQRRRGGVPVAALESRTLLAAITVNSLADNTTAGDNLVTLREAIIAANTNVATDLGHSGVVGLDTITFTPGLTGTITLSLGQMSITQSVTITGQSAANTIINGNNASRIFLISSGDTTLEKLTLTGGKTTTTFDHGGAIRSTSTGTLTVSQCTLSGNSTTGYKAYGGAIFAHTGFGNPSSAVTVSQSTLSGNSTAGNDAHGGAIFARDCAVTVSQSTLSGNSTAGDDANGGAIYADVSSALLSLTVRQSTLSGNSTTGFNGRGGAIFSTTSAVTVRQSTLSGNSTAGNSAYGGAIYANFGALTVSQCTLSGNSTTGSSANGGAIFAGHGAVTVSQSTLTGNHADLSQGGGIFSFSSPITFQNSIVAGNTDSGTAPDIRKSPTDALTVTRSLIGNNTGISAVLPATVESTPDANGNFIGGSGASALNPLLGPLQNNGGPTFTRAVLTGSLAINSGDNTLIPLDTLDLDGDTDTAEAVPFDQRGVPFARVFGGTVDMGAIEAQALNLSVDTNVDENDGNYAAGDLSLREAIGLANLNPGADTITFGNGAGSEGTNFTDGVADTITLSLGQMSITQSVTITGQSAANTIINGNNASRIFSITSGSTTLEKLTLTGGKTTVNFGGGGAIRSISFGTLTVRQCTLSGNSTTGFAARGGAIFSTSGAVTVSQSTLSGNFTTGIVARGGAIFSSSGAVTVSQSTLSGNSTAGGGARGGAIFAISGLVTVSQSTLTGNKATLAAGGGMFSQSSPITISNSIIAGNTDNGTAPDIRKSPNDALTVKHSLIGNNTGISTVFPATFGVTPDADGNFIGGSGASALNPLLGQLQNNGGPTFTRAVLTGSLAINSGDNTLIPLDALDLDGDSNTAEKVPFDQRGTGFPRIFNTTVDMGAFEAAEASSFVVTTSNDLVNAYDGLTSLREAVAYANLLAGADTITFGNGSGLGGTNFTDGTADTITLSLGQMSITQSVTITGMSAAKTIINGNNASRIFSITTGNTTLQKLTLTGGRTSTNNDGGGAIRSIFNGTLTVSQCTLSGNSTTGSSANGGAIYAGQGAVTVSQSTLSGNSTTGNNAHGGAIFAGTGAVTVSQSTLSGNFTTGNAAHGGAISAGFGAVTVSQSTLTGNRAELGQGGGIFSDSSPVTIQNSIVAGNTDDPDNVIAPDIRRSPLASLTVSHSLIGNNTGTGLTVAQTADGSGNFIGSGATPINPLLGALANNGGPTFTHAVLAGSKALNKGDNTLIPLDTLDLDGDTDTVEPVPFDQRGAGFVRIAGGTVDIGAIEAQALNLSVDTNVDENDGNYAAGDLSLREAIGLANLNPGAGTITFGDGSGAGGTNFTDGVADTITLSLGQMSISETVTITGQSAANTIINGNNASRIFSITSGDTTLQKLTLTGGRTTANYEGGGAIRSTSSGTLTVRQCTLSGNSTTGINANGGAIFSYNGAVTVSQSTLSGNSTTGNYAVGGAIFSYNGAVTVSQSTLSGNSTAGVLASGGAIFAQDGAVTVSQSTLSGNFTTGTNANGGAIYARSGVVTVSQSTLTGNQATLAAGGGMFSHSSPITIQNSIVAGNTDNGTAPDIRKSPLASLTVSHSLIGNNTGTGLTEAQVADGNGNFIGSSTGAGIIDPLLGPLQNNGGPAKTHALLAGSLAISRGLNSLIPADANDLDGDNNTVEPVPFDQRGVGFVRIDGGTVDMGAFEKDTTAPTVMIVVADNSLLAGETSLVTFTFNEAVTGFTNSDLIIQNGTLTAVTSSNGVTWTATFTPTAGLNDATNVITLNKALITDLAGNAGSGSTSSNNYAINTI